MAASMRVMLPFRFCGFNKLGVKFDTGCKFKRSIYIESPSYSEKRLQEGKRKPAVEDCNVEFRKLELIKQQEHVRKGPQRRRPPLIPPRYKRMAVDQDWPSVWPAAQSFKASVVPLPLRQGYVDKDAAPPVKAGNLELMKIPNFLHLTPPAVKRHCEAIKHFCTPWPEGLETDEQCDHHFPVQVISSDYCHSSPSIRDPRARIITIQIKLAVLKLNERARDKLLRLVGSRYDDKTDILSIVTDRCPLRKHNYDYSVYLLTALYHESLKTENWEFEKQEIDMEKYVWPNSRSQQAVVKLLASTQQRSEQDILKDPAVEEFSQAVTDMHNTGEESQAVSRYKAVTLRLLGLPLDPEVISDNSSVVPNVKNLSARASQSS